MVVQVSKPFKSMPMHLFTEQYGALFVAFFCSAGLILLLSRPALAWGWVDHPSTRKHHHRPVPLIGGIAMCMAASVSIVLLPEKIDAYTIFLLSIWLMALVGLYDDLHAVRPASRFLFEIAAVLLMALGAGIQLNDLGDLFGLGAVTLGLAAIPFTIFSVVGMVNAINMIDGLDGLAGGVALIAVLWLVAVAATGPIMHVEDVQTLLALALAIAGFLCFNLRHPGRARASVFMGDAGSMMLGFALSWFVVHLSQGEQRVMAPMTAVWILGLPLMDTVTVMLRRIRARQSPFNPDRQHLHHLLLSRGLSDGQVTARMLALSAASGALGAGAWWIGIPESVQFYTFLVAFVIYYRLTSRIWMRLCQERDAAAGLDRRRPVVTPVSASMSDLSGGNLVTEQK